MSGATTAVPGSHRDRARELADRLRRAVDRTPPESGPLTLFFSGGLDSSLLAFLSAPRREVTLLTVGLSGAPDLRAGERAARLLGLPWRAVELGDSALRTRLVGVASHLQALSEPARSVLAATWAAVDSTPEGFAWQGQGADELFGGYAHFEGLSPDLAARRAERDWNVLVGEDWPRVRALARTAGVRLAAPFLDSELAAWVRALPPADRFPPGPRKMLLRTAAVRLGLPDPLARAPKRAFQYGSRVSAALRRISAASAAVPPPG